MCIGFVSNGYVYSIIFFLFACYSTCQKVYAHFIFKKIMNKVKIKFQYLPTIFMPSAVRKRTTCIFVLCPVLAARTFSTRDHTLRTDPASTLYVLRRNPTSQSKPNVTFLQLPRLEKKHLISIMINILF